MADKKRTIESEIDALDAEIRRGQCNLSEFVRRRTDNEKYTGSIEEPNEWESELRRQVSQLITKKENLVIQRESQVAKSLDLLKLHADMIADSHLKQITLDVLAESRFVKCSASRRQHQAYDGGLVVHTAEVLEAAMLLGRSKFLSSFNTDVVITATIFHDYGKIWDYVPAKSRADVREKQERYDYTPHQSLIRHLPRSYAVFMAAAGDKVDEEMKSQIGHCILAHHGRTEWGSPAEPQTPEAYAIHFADMMSAFCAKDYYTRD